MAASSVNDEPSSGRRLPAFSALYPERIEPEIDRALARAREVIAGLLNAGEAPTWESFALPIERELEALSRAWAPVRHLHSVQATEALRTAYNACLPRITRFHTDIRQDRRLYEAYRVIAEDTPDSRLDPTQRKALDDALRHFRLAGIDLPADEREQLAGIESELAELQSRFSENVLDATHAWRKPITDEEDLSGLTADAKAMARDAARREGRVGWLLTLDFPLFHAVITTAASRELRAEIHRAWTTRASDQGPHAGRWDNAPLMERIVELRQRKADLLGYHDYAELALEERMVERPEHVLRFLHDIAGRALPPARTELAELSTFAAESCGLSVLRPWDIAYTAEMMRRARYTLSDDTLKPYFPESKVIGGLFRITGALFGIQFQACPDVDTWHPDVIFYSVHDADGDELGGLYFDLYARSDKRGGAWLAPCGARLRDGTDVQKPIAFLTCNLSPPVDGEPALFTHEEVRTLFHEFGHGLHHVLTQVDIPSLSGINGVEWDAIELPSQLLENWCWSTAGLKEITGHVETGQPMPDALIECLQQSRNFQAALSILRQIEFSLFDFRLYQHTEPVTASDIRTLLDSVRKQVALIQQPDYNRFAHSFGHIFAGGYAAGYYSYLWAQVLAADASAAFADEGELNPEVGRRFREAILERGGSRPTLTGFREFRGRDPDPDALLRYYGLTTTTAWAPGDE